MNTSSKKLPDFFKVFLPKNSSERMLVPIAFIAQLNKPIPKNTILQLRSGRRWLVKVVKHDKEVYFQDGWPEFVQDNNISMEDFLVFSYDNNNKFDVTIFGKCMCEKKENFLNTREEVEKQGMAGEVEEQEERESEMEEEEEEDASSDNPNGDEEEEEEIHESIDVDEGHDDGNEGCEDLGRLKKKKTYHRNQETEAGESSKSNQSKFRADDYIQASNPYFVPLLSARGLRYLHVPMDILRDFKLRMCDKIKFHDPNGRKWDGEVLTWTDGRTVIKGWKAVCRWNHIKEGDHCICELLLENGPTCHAIRVRIVPPRDINHS